MADVTPGQTTTHLPGRFVGIVVRDTTRADGYVFLRGADGTEYFAHKSGWLDAALFYAIQLNEPVSFKVSVTSKGKRAWDVREPHDGEKELVDGLADVVAAAQANAHRAGELREGGAGWRRRSARQAMEEDDHDEA